MSPERAAALLDKVGEDEPVFILRAQDALSTAAILDWMNRSINWKVSDEKIGEAEKIVREFQSWQDTHDTKLPD